MKKNLCLFLISLTLLSLFANADATYLKFVQQEEVDMQFHAWNTNSINVYANDAPQETACFAIYNTERNGTRRNKVDIEGFKLETDIHFVLWPYQQANIEIKILDNDIGDGKSSSLVDTNTVEICQTIGSQYRFWTFKHYRIQCNTRNFKKNYVIAVCSWNRYLKVLRQRHLLTVSGFVDSKTYKKAYK